MWIIKTIKSHKKLNSLYDGCEDLKKERNVINDKQLEIIHKQIYISHNLCEL